MNADGKSMLATAGRQATFGIGPNVFGTSAFIELQEHQPVESSEPQQQPQCQRSKRLRSPSVELVEPSVSQTKAGIPHSKSADASSSPRRENPVKKGKVEVHRECLANAAEATALEVGMRKDVPADGNHAGLDPELLELKAMLTSILNGQKNMSAQNDGLWEQLVGLHKLVTEYSYASARSNSDVPNAPVLGQARRNQPGMATSKPERISARAAMQSPNSLLRPYKQMASSLYQQCLLAKQVPPAAAEPECVYIRGFGWVRSMSLFEVVAPYQLSEDGIELLLQKLNKMAQECARQILSGQAQTQPRSADTVSSADIPGGSEGINDESARQREPEASKRVVRAMPSLGTMKSIEQMWDLWEVGDKLSNSAPFKVFRDHTSRGPGFDRRRFHEWDSVASEIQHASQSTGSEPRSIAQQLDKERMATKTPVAKFVKATIMPRVRERKKISPI